MYDEASGLYYLSARYYDPDSGRFLSRDSYRGETADPRSQNLYGYCYNNPIRYVDLSGHIPVETVFDLASLGWSYNNLVNNPSWVNFGYLAWDAVAAMVPYAPGSYVLKPVSTGIKIFSRADGYVKVGVWTMDKFERGYEIERALGGIANNFPKIDKFVEAGRDDTYIYLSRVTSIKSVDLTLPSYQSTGKLRFQLQKYVEQLKDFDYISYKGNDYKLIDGVERILEIAIPPVELTAKQVAAFEKVTESAAKEGIKIVTRIVY